jgi:DNA-directed RNA polymerase specialized sigma24 family protein
MNNEIRSDRSNEIVLPNYKIQKLMDKETYADFLKGKSHKQDLFLIGKLTEEQARVVREKVSSLPAEELAVIYLKFWEELSPDEISKTLDLSTVAVSELLQSALLRLKNILLQTEPKKRAVGEFIK